MPTKRKSHTNKRRKLGEVRAGLTKRSEACGFEYYITVNFFDETAEPGEVFITIAKEGSAIAGFLDAIAITISVALQYSVPWSVLYDKYLNQIFEPRDDKNSSLVHALGVTINYLVELKKERNQL